MNESRISERKVKSSEKDILPGILSPFAGVSIFHVCSMESSRCFLKNHFPLCRSPTAQPVLLTCQLEQRALDGVERGDSGKGSRYAGVTEEEVNEWGGTLVTVEKELEVGFATFYFIQTDSR